MKFIAPATLHNGIVCNKETDKKTQKNIQKRYSSDV